MNIISKGLTIFDLPLAFISLFLLLILVRVCVVARLSFSFSIELSISILKRKIVVICYVWLLRTLFSISQHDGTLHAALGAMGSISFIMCCAEVKFVNLVLREAEFSHRSIHCVPEVYMSALLTVSIRFIFVSLGPGNLDILIGLKCLSLLIELFPAENLATLARIDLIIAYELLLLCFVH